MATKNTIDRPSDAVVEFRRPAGSIVATVAIVRDDGQAPDRVEINADELAATTPPAGALAWLARVYAAALLKGGWV